MPSMMDQGKATGSPTEEKVTPASEDADLYAATACVSTLIEHGIPGDIMELLVFGSKRQGIAPHALSKAIKATILAYRGFEASAVSGDRTEADASSVAR